jgi:hypothetical protein
MPKYYCNYCDIFLTHDAPRVIKDHNAGWKHGARVREHYLSQNLETMARNVGEAVKDYEERKELVPVPAPISSKQKPSASGFAPPSMPGQMSLGRMPNFSPPSLNFITQQMRK